MEQNVYRTGIPFLTFGLCGLWALPTAQYNLVNFGWHALRYSLKFYHK